MRRHHLATLLATPVAALALTATPALAHTEVKSTSPTKGSTAKKSIRSVTVTFTQASRAAP